MSSYFTQDHWIDENNGTKDIIVKVGETDGVLGIQILQNTGALSDLTYAYHRGVRKDLDTIVYGDAEDDGMTKSDKSNSSVDFLDFDLSNKPSDQIKLVITNGHASVKAKVLVRVTRGQFNK